MTNQDEPAARRHRAHRDGERLTMRFGYATARVIGALLYADEDCVQFKRAAWLKSVWMEGQHRPRWRSA